MLGSVPTPVRSLLLVAAAVSLYAGQPASPRPCEIPGSSEVAAKVVSLLGQVSVLHDSQPWALNVGETVQAKQVIISGADGNAVFCVSDGSSFEVFPNSEVVFRDNPPNWRDMLDVLVGRIRVQIQKLGGPNPNRVQTPTATISVRGTIFDVSVDDEERTTVVAVEEGQVEVRHRLIPSSNPKLVNAGETLKVYPDEPLSRSRFDRGAAAQRVLRALMDAVYTGVSGPRGGTTSGSGGGSGPPVTCGSACSGQTPPPPPPSAPPPASGH
jgi:ferric-dicitrate binding protein FerR (iron transport regulator)